MPFRKNPETVRRIFETGKPVVSDLYLGALTKRPLIGIDVPVITKGKVVYDLAMTFPPDGMSSLLKQQRFPLGGYGSVLDSRGAVVARSVSQSRHVGGRGATALQHAMSLASEGGLESTNLDGTPVLAAFCRSPLSNWSVVIGVGMNEQRSKILIVDDDPTNIRFLEGALKRDYQLHVAANGFEAIRQVKSQAPDRILLDVMMPDLNGFEVAKAIKSDESFADIPIIFLSARDPCGTEAEGLEVGGIDYLSKPVEVQLLKLRIRNHLELKGRNDLIRCLRDLLEITNADLEAALARVKRLESTLAICMHCKSVRNTAASWQGIEEYLLIHADALFSHGICPKCLAKHYPDFAETGCGCAL